MTVSSVTTATAPRLDDSSFSLKSNDDDFGNMFANVGSNPSREVRPKTLQPMLVVFALPARYPFSLQANVLKDIAAARPQPLRSAQRAAPPDPIRVNRQVPVESSPYSWHSQNSGDGLIGSPSPSHTVVRASPQLSNQRNATMETIRSEDSNEHNMFDSSTMHHSPEIAAARIRNTNSPRAPPSAFPTSSMARVRAQSNGASSIQRSDAGSDLEQPPFDPSLLANAQLATQYEERISSPTQMQASSSKVMTPAQFERYKQQKEDTRRYNKVFGKADSDDGSGDDYDDDEDDQQEREKSAAKQRKKQEAHLAVYRQQMRKVTGDMPSPEPRPGTSTGTQLPTNASQNDLSLNRRMSQLTVDTSIQPNYAMSKPPIDDEPEEDEDVPLGILAAHGFPNKNKPPTRLAASNSNPNLRNLAQVQGGASVVGDATNRGSLPAFARHLPVDPYYGASLVHQSERTALNMSQTQLAAQPQPSGAATAHPLHPAGLVGVIAGEERARAMRRGSPNTQGGYDMPPGAQQGMRTGAPAFIPGFPQPGMQMPQPMLTPSEHAQLQMSQSMTQMMQMQMQWMQQMSSMMGQNPNMQMAQMPPMPMQGMANMQTQQQHPGMPHRPQSVPLQMATGGQQRSMSTLHPGMGQAWHSSSPAVPQLNLGSVYAPSIAPSERSNVGLAPRYRPVSTAPQQPEPQRPDWNKRASTFSSATFRPWTNENGPMKSAMSTVRVIPQANDDEDDEQGWAEMKAKKDKKQKGWKLRKGGNQLQELYNTPA